MHIYTEMVLNLSQSVSKRVSVYKQRFCGVSVMLVILQQTIKRLVILRILSSVDLHQFNKGREYPTFPVDTRRKSFNKAKLFVGSPRQIQSPRAFIHGGYRNCSNTCVSPNRGCRSIEIHSRESINKLFNHKYPPPPITMMLAEFYYPICIFIL